jgi:hypothetical protein
MDGDAKPKQYGTRKRVWMAILSILIVLGNLYVIYLESRLPFDFYLMIGVMVVCSILLVHVFGHIAITGRRPGYMQDADQGDRIDD